MWKAIAVVAGVMLVGVVAMHAFIPAKVAPYLIGATLASVPLWVYSMMVVAPNITRYRRGIDAEEWTAEELRQLRRLGWFTVNHVMLERADVDHALLGPAGFFAVETKFRSSWPTTENELASIVASASKSARRLDARVQQWRKARVRPLVVLWGPGVSNAFPEAVEIGGVMVCAGHQLVDHLRSLPVLVEDSTIRAAFAKLDEYVERRDVGEALVHGDPARTFGQHYGDLAAVTTTFGASLLAILSVVSLKPTGAWSVALAAGLVLLGVAIRRRWAGPRTLRVTTTLITTAGGLGGLLVTAMVLGA